MCIYNILSYYSYCISILWLVCILHTDIHMHKY